MSFTNENIIGIVGGMGPQAGISLCNSILTHSGAVTDQQHYPVILMSLPGHIPDRTLFLEGTIRINPAFSIAAIIRKLETAGARIIGIPCNTSHSPAIYDVIMEELDKAGSRVTLLHMPAETGAYLHKNHQHIGRIGLMTTNGTYRSGVYADLLQSLGYEVILPDPGFQNDVIHRMIYDRAFGVKANANKVTGQARLLADQALQFFQRRGAEAVILGCTELPFVIPEMTIGDMLMIDPADILSRALIRDAGAGSLIKNEQKETYGNRNTL